jgi:hypothetical protein
VIKLKYAQIWRTDKGCESLFYDGVKCPSYAHTFEAHYRVISHRCGYGDDVHAYCFEHDFVHHFLNEMLFDQPSPALYATANKRVYLPEAEAVREEFMVQGFQRWMRAHERPIISLPMGWDGLKQLALEMLEKADVECRLEKREDA